MTIIKCYNCGYKKELFGNEDIYEETCELCGGKMIIILQVNKEGITEKDLIQQIINYDELEQMEDNIISLGYKKVWNIIEKINDPRRRTIFRQLFFKAGGIIPKNIE